MWDEPAILTSTDAGGFYCEHALFAHLDATLRLDTCRGTERRVGFLHVPDDEPSYGRLGPRRSEVTLHVIERMVRALLDGRTRGRLLLTGFGAFGAVTDNPTGSVASDPGILARLLMSLEPNARPTVRFEHSCLVVQTASFQIFAHALPVSDAALDPSSPTSIWGLHQRVAPDAALGLGVVANGDTIERDYRIEICATDRNLVRSQAWEHRADRGATVIRPARALVKALRPP